MRGRYEDERRIGVLTGLGTQCRAATGESCDRDIHYDVTHMTTKGGIRKGWQSFHKPPPSSDISKHSVGNRCRDDMPVESRGVLHDGRRGWSV